MPPADRITLTGSQRRELGRLVRAGRAGQRLVTRAKIVLAAAEATPNAVIAASLGVCEDTVRKWRNRWCAMPGVASLGDAKRSGRPPVFTAVQVARVKAMACTPPQDKGLPLSRWSCPDLAEQAIADGICASIIGGNRPPVALRGRAQALAVPVVDLHYRPRVCRQGPTRA